MENTGVPDPQLIGRVPPGPPRAPGPCSPPPGCNPANRTNRSEERRVGPQRGCGPSESNETTRTYHPARQPAQPAQPVQPNCWDPPANPWAAGPNPSRAPGKWKIQGSPTPSL